MHYYQFNIGDYARDTTGLSPIEDIAYRRLIDKYFLNEKPVNGDAESVSRIIGMREYAEEVQYILCRFFVQSENGTWVHGRIERDIAEYKSKQIKASLAGKASGEARRSTSVKQALNVRSTDDERTLNQPITINQEPDKDYTQKPAVPACPVEQIIQLYRDTAKRLPSVRIVPDSVKAHIRARWLQDKRFQSLEFWKGFFEYCEGNKFLSGQSETRGDRKPFRASLAWVVNATNFAKIINEDYA